jgi:5'-phosphate synthase pdxT subunit
MKVVGVLALQGDVTEHMRAVEAAAQASGIAARAEALRRPAQVSGLAAAILPGGESTTISKMLHTTGLFAPLKARAQEGSIAILGTCAGMIALAKTGDDQVERTRTELLGLVDMDVDRNAFGRQRESFEADLDVRGFDRPLHAVFIRAPAARRVYGRASALATLQGRVVFVEQGNLLATAFHPELTHDARVHAMLLTRA